MADEPTGEVDWPTAQLILKLLHDLRDRYGLTIVLVTHDPRVAEQADRVIAIRDGRTSSETIRTESQEPGIDNQPVAGSSEFSVLGSREELVVLDSAGRLQIPGEQRALAGIGRRARVELVDGGILIRPSDDEKIEAVQPLVAEDGAEAAYRSLYSAEPPPATKQTNRTTRWRIGRKKQKR